VRDLKASLAFLAVAIGACVGADRLGFGSVLAPEPGFFPWLGGLTLGGLSLVLFVQAWRGRDTAPPATAGSARPAILLAALALYVPLLEPVGYPIVTTALCIVALRILDARRWPVVVGVSIVIALGSFLLFQRGLGVELPLGVLAFLG
jgi:hypothetical protein